MKTTFLTLFFVFCGVCFVPVMEVHAADNVFETIRERVRQVFWEDAPEKEILDSYVADYISDIGADGSWADINYANSQYTDWQPMYHLDRVMLMALAYSKEGSALYNDAALGSHIDKALAFWHTKWAAGMKSPDWYAHQVSAAQKMGVILILMRVGDTPLSEVTENKILSIMADTSAKGGGNYNQSGSQGQAYNRVAISTHFVYRAALTENANMMKDAVEKGVYYHLPNNMNSNGKIEGLKEDDCFSQHSPQLYIQGYGTGLLNDVTNVATFTAGTPYAIPDAKLTIIDTFARSAYFKTFRGKTGIYNATGRFLSRPGEITYDWNYLKNPRKLSANLRLFGLPTRIAKNFKALKPEHADFYDGALKRLTGEIEPDQKITTSHRHFFRNEYSIFESSKYTVDVRMTSPRVNRCENGNSENIYGYFLSDGGTSIHVDGDEYVDAFAVWEWSRMPGVTAPVKALSGIPKPVQWSTPGASVYAGGVSDSICGVTAFLATDPQVSTTAKKSWFFFDNEVVCLGSGIQSSATEQINTTVNQCISKGDVTISTNGNKTTLAKNGTDLSSISPQWVWQNKVAYIFPQGGNINISNKATTGKWTTNNTTLISSIYGENISRDIFKLWFNHGVKPTDESYAYIIAGGRSLQDMETYNANHLKIHVNSDTVQVVENTKSGLWGVVFFEAARFNTADFSIRADHPCILMLRDVDKTQVKVQIADPTQLEDSVVICYTNNVLTGKRGLVCKLPQGNYAGSSQKYVISQSTPDYIEPPVKNDILIYPEADAFVRNGTNGSTTYGTTSAQLLEVKYDSENYARETYIRFSWAELGITPDDINNVSLVFYSCGGGTAANQATLQLRQVENVTWNENTLCWNNKPTVLSAIIDQQQGSNTGSVTFDITSFMKQQLTEGKTALSFNLSIPSPKKSNEAFVYFYSKESSAVKYRPRIVIEKKVANSISYKSYPNTDVKVYPVPLKQGSPLFVDLKVSSGQTMKLVVTDMVGRIIETTSVKVDPGNNQLIQSTGNMKQGFYIISLYDEKGALLADKKILVID